MQFQVPQFTELEDKIIGPFTLKQFLYILGAAFILFILFKLVNLFVFVILSIPIIVLTIALAFVKINNQPFISLIKNFFGFLKKPDYYIWKNPSEKPAKKEKQIPKIIKTSPTKENPLKEKKHLKEIGWKIEIE
jgi:hypothetical protein